MTYIGSGTATLVIESPTGFIALGAAVPVAVFSANGTTFFHYPENSASLVGSRSLTTGGAEVFLNPYPGINGSDSFTGDTFGHTMIDADGNDIIIGEAGTDFVSYEQAASRVTVDLRSTDDQYVSADQGVDRLMEIENILGSTYNDRLIGDTGTNVIFGGRGNDSIYGMDGNDRLHGGLGTDNLWSGAAMTRSFFGLSMRAPMPTRTQSAISVLVTIL